MTVLIYLFLVIAGYLLGSVSASIELSKLRGSDVRSHGSGNAGATNMARSFGLIPAITVLAGDMLKAVASVWLGHFTMGDWGMFAAGLACLIGHCFPVYYGFRGGKGVSVGTVLLFAVDVRVGLCAVAVFGVVAVVSKKVSIGSVCADIAALVLAFILGLPLPRLLLIAMGGCIVVWRHHENLKRFLNGTEPDFKLKSHRSNLK